MSREDLKSLFERITVWSRRGERAPHKPLLLLYALGKCSRDESRQIPFPEVDSALQYLLKEFGPSRKSYHPEYPFWRLQNDSLWEVSDVEKLERRKSNIDAKKTELLKHNVTGGFPKSIYDLLRQDHQLLAEIVQDLLDQNFPTSIHEDILDAVGIELEYQVIKRLKRDPHFRDQVMIAYEYRCAICGLDIRLGNNQVGIEAAHIKWHQAGGPDIVPNGVALCVLHHKMFDRGVMTISRERQVLVSEYAHGTKGFEEWIMRFHGTLLREPQRPEYYPKTEFLGWHVKEVFQAPARYWISNSESV